MRTLNTVMLFCFLAAIALGQATGDHPSFPVTRDRLEASHRKYLNSLIREFAEVDPGKRWNAVLKVAAIGPLAHDELVSALDDGNPLVQRGALLALGRIGGSGVEASVQRAVLGRSLQEEERAVAVLVLGQVGATSSLPLLRELATNKRSSPVRRAAHLALGRLRDVKGTSQALSAIHDEPLEERVVAAVIAAAVTGERSSLPAILDDLGHRSVSVRRAAALGAASLGEATAIPDLLIRSRLEKSEEVKAVVALALGAFEDEATLEVVTMFSRSRIPATQSAAFASLSLTEAGQKALVQALKTTRGVDDLKVLALASAGASSGALRMQIEKLLDHRRGEVRSSAGLALAAMGDPDSSQAVLGWVGRERDPDVLSDALFVAGALDLKEARVSAEQGDRISGEEEILRVLAGRRDPQHIQWQLELRLQKEGARWRDRLRIELAWLVQRSLRLDSVVRRDASEGGGGEPSSGGEGEGGSGPAKGRVDLRQASFEWDLKLWFAKEPYLSLPRGARQELVDHR